MCSFVNSYHCQFQLFYSVLLLYDSGWCTVALLSLLLLLLAGVIVMMRVYVECGLAVCVSELCDFGKQVHHLLIHLFRLPNCERSQSTLHVHIQRLIYQFIVYLNGFYVLL